MPSIMRYSLFAAASLGLGGCSSITGSSDPLSGCWDEDFVIPGASFQFTLQEKDRVVTGSGSFTGELAPSGTVTMSGHRSGTRVTLEMISTTVHGSSTSVLHGTLSGVRLVVFYIYSNGEFSSLESFHRCS